MTLTVQHVRLGNDDDRDGVLIYRADVLVAVLSRLSGLHGERAGLWFLECGFGIDRKPREYFANPQEACDWIDE